MSSILAIRDLFNLLISNNPHHGNGPFCVVSERTIWDLLKLPDGCTTAEHKVWVNENIKRWELPSTASHALMTTMRRLDKRKFEQVHDELMVMIPPDLLKLLEK